MVLHK